MSYFYKVDEGQDGVYLSQLTVDAWLIESQLEQWWKEYIHTYILLCNVATPMDPQKVTSYLAVSENELSFFIFLISIHKNDDDDQNAKW